MPPGWLLKELNMQLVFTGLVVEQLGGLLAN